MLDLKSFHVTFCPVGIVLTFDFSTALVKNFFAFP